MKRGLKMKGKMPTLDLVVVILVIVGALNWGLVSLGYNLVEMILGAGTTLTKIVYGLVGLAGLYKVYMLAKK
jgi:uncharacterized membrane protein YuzA (DUF378 family)